MPQGIYQRKPEMNTGKNPNSWNNKFQKGHLPSKETREKISLAMKGKPKTEECKRKLSEIFKTNNIGFQKGHTVWNKGKKTGFVSKTPEETKKKISKINKGRFSGEKSHWWKGGIKTARLPRNSFEGRKWRTAVYVRDNFTCQVCGEVGGRLNAHHIKSWIDYPKLRLVVDNGITLCVECHKLTDNYGGRNNKKVGE